VRKQKQVVQIRLELRVLILITVFCVNFTFHFVKREMGIRFWIAGKYPLIPDLIFTPVAIFDISCF